MYTIKWGRFTGELPAGRAEVLLFSGSLSANGGQASGKSNDICVGAIGARMVLIAARSLEGAL
jgi:hypothetical protein